jgi:hypothetical protein
LFIAAPEFVEHQNLPIPAFDVPVYEIHRATTIIIAPTGGVNVNGIAPRSLEALGIREIQNHFPFFVGDRQASGTAALSSFCRRVGLPNNSRCSRGVNVAKDGRPDENVGGEPLDILAANGKLSRILIVLRQATPSM